MSVALLIEYDNDLTQSVPIATEVVFRNYWQPLCVELGLTWVPLFQSGLPVEAIDLTSILSEIVDFEQAARSNTELLHVADQALNLLRNLQSIDFKAVASVYIG